MQSMMPGPFKVHPGRIRIWTETV